MSWNQYDFEPHRPLPNKSNCPRYPSPSLSRLLGTTLGSIGGIFVFSATTSLFNISTDFMYTEIAWGFKEIFILIVSLISVLFCGLIGLVLGASITVVSENKNYIISVLWNYLSIGSIIWISLLGLFLQKLLGDEGIKPLFEKLGSYSTLYIFGIGAIGSIAIAVMLLITGQLKINVKPKFMSCLLVALPLTLIMAYTQFNWLGIETQYWMFDGLIFPLILIPVSAYMVARDLFERHKILSNLKNRG